MPLAVAHNPNGQFSALNHKSDRLGPVVNATLIWLMSLNMSTADVARPMQRGDTSAAVCHRQQSSFGAPPISTEATIGFDPLNVVVVFLSSPAAMSHDLSIASKSVCLSVSSSSSPSALYANITCLRQVRLRIRWQQQQHCGCQHCRSPL